MDAEVDVAEVMNELTDQTGNGASVSASGDLQDVVNSDENQEQIIEAVSDAVETTDAIEDTAPLTGEDDEVAQDQIEPEIQAQEYDGQDIEDEHQQNQQQHDTIDSQHSLASLVSDPHLLESIHSIHSHASLSSQPSTLSQEISLNPPTFPQVQYQPTQRPPSPTQQQTLVLKHKTPQSAALLAYKLQLSLSRAHTPSPKLTSSLHKPHSTRQPLQYTQPISSLLVTGQSPFSRSPSSVITRPRLFPAPLPHSKSATIIQKVVLGLKPSRNNGIHLIDMNDGFMDGGGKSGGFVGGRTMPPMLMQGLYGHKKKDVIQIVGPRR